MKISFLGKGGGAGGCMKKSLQAQALITETKSKRELCNANVINFLQVCQQIPVGGMEGRKEMIKEHSLSIKLFSEAQ